MDEIQKRLMAWRLSPELFVRECLGAEPTVQQSSILAEMAKVGAKVSVRSGHGTGKSTLLSWLILHKLLMFEDCRVPCTAASGHQLSDILWPEVRKWRDRMSPYMKEQVIINADRICILGSEQSRFAIARTSRRENPEALAGLHAANMLFIIDEASGVFDEVFETAEGALSTPGAQVIMTSNPTRTEGYFYRSQTKDRDFWSVFKLSCVDSPIVDKNFIERMKKKYGENSNVYKVRVMGEFPEGSDDILIPISWVEEAIGREITPSEPKIAGLDVARFGDDATALIIRQGNVVTHIEQWRNIDLMGTVGRVMEKYKASEKRMFDRIYVDVIGLGAGVADRLSEMGVPVVAVNVSETSTQSDKFNKQRDELWWAVREELHQKRMSIVRNLERCEELAGELSTVRYGFTSNGKIKIESKADMKNRGVESPNLADALCLTYSLGTPNRGSMYNKKREVKVANMGAWV